MPYSSLPIPNIPATKIIDQDLTIYLSPPQHWAGKTGSTTNWSGLTFGSDSTGDGTLNRPYASLRRAWQKAQEYIIQGNATLYIQFQKGIYGYTYDPNDRSTNPFPENLYHPQGSRIVIQGDLEGIRQRYLYRVKDYSWDLSRMAYYGHTGTVNLWYAQHAYGQTATNASGQSYVLGGNVTPFAGTTSHGFTGEDENGYVSLFNAAQGSYYSVYQDPYNGVNVNRKYAYAGDDRSNVGHQWMRAQFNHGLSYEEARGIIGLARIEGASANPFDLRLQFKNLNLDGRICVYPGVTMNGRLGGGLNNTLPFAGSQSPANMIANNYPEPQYSVPNGYYGLTYGIGSSGALIDPKWGNLGAVCYGTGPSGGANLLYPPKAVYAPTDTHITDDPHILTNFPVVIKVYASSVVTEPQDVLAGAQGYYSNPSGVNERLQRPVPFMLDGCNVGSIRNLMVVNGDLEARSYSVMPRGSTLAQCSGMDTDVEIEPSLGASFYGRAMPCMILKNGSTTKIRNLGMLGWGIGANGVGGNATAVSVSQYSELELDECLDSTSNFSSSGDTSYPGYTPAGSAFSNIELGKITNTPVLMISHGAGLAVDNGSRVTFNHSYGVARVPKRSSFGIQPVWIQNITGNYAVYVIGNNSSATFSPLFISCYHMLPGKFAMRMILPVLPGADVFGGNTASVMHPSVFNAAGGRGATYSSIVGYAVAGSGRTAFARFLAGYTLGPTFANASTPTRSGWGNATWTNTGAGTIAASTVQNQPVIWHGTALNAHCFDGKTSITDFLNQTTVGATIEFYAYHDVNEGITVANQYLAFGKNGCVIRTTGGVTATATDATYGYTYSFGGITGSPYNYASVPDSPVSLYDYSSQGYGLVATDSTINLIGGCLDVAGKSYIPLHLNGFSCVLRSPNSHMNLQGGAHSNVYLSGGALLDFDNGGLVARNGQYFSIYADGGGSWNQGIQVRQGSTLKSWGNIVSIGPPAAVFGTTNLANSPNNKVGLSTKIATAEPTADVGIWAGIAPSSPPLTVYGASTLRLPTRAYGTVVLAYDGGVEFEQGSTYGKVAGIDQICQVYGITSLFHLWNVCQGKVGGAGAGSPPIMTRGAYGRNARSGGQLLYNAPRGASAWYLAFVNSTFATAGWVGPRNTGAPLEGTTNLAYVEPIMWAAPAAGVQAYGTAVYIPSGNQRAAGATADPPGYSGPGIGISVNTMVSTDVLGA